jgi:hypothetical protein
MKQYTIEVIVPEEGEKPYINEIPCQSYEQALTEFKKQVREVEQEIDHNYFQPSFEDTETRIVRLHEFETCYEVVSTDPHMEECFRKNEEVLKETHITPAYLGGLEKMKAPDCPKFDTLIIKQ